MTSSLRPPLRHFLEITVWGSVFQTTHEQRRWYGGAGWKGSPKKAKKQDKGHVFVQYNRKITIEEHSISRLSMMRSSSSPLLLQSVSIKLVSMESSSLPVGVHLDHRLCFEYSSTPTPTREVLLLLHHQLRYQPTVNFCLVSIETLRQLIPPATLRWGDCNTKTVTLSFITIAVKGWRFRV